MLSDIRVTIPIFYFIRKDVMLDELFLWRPIKLIESTYIEFMKEFIEFIKEF